MRNLKGRIFVTALVSLLLWVLTSSTRADDRKPTYILTDTLTDLIADDEKFKNFAEKVKVDADRIATAPSELAETKLLLTIRVHLAHCFHDNNLALAVAAKIKEMTKNPAEKAFAGLITQASVAARLRTVASDESPLYVAAFGQEFRNLLELLPHTPEIEQVLVLQREKLISTTREALLAEVRDKIVPAMHLHGGCDLEIADQLIRVRYRLVGIIPIKEEALNALDTVLHEYAGRRAAR